MPDGSGKIINGELVAKQNITSSVNTRVTTWLDGILTWYGSAAPADFPLSMLDSGSTFGQISAGEIPTTNLSGFVDHNDIGPIINTFCDKFTLLRKCEFRRYQDERATGSPTPVYVLKTTKNGYAKFINNPTIPANYVQAGGHIILSGTVSGDFLNNDIDTGDPINSGTPYSIPGFNDFIDDIVSQLSVNSEDLVELEYYYCHSQCHSSCHGSCSHSFSDIRLKTNIEECSDYLPGIPIIIFNWKKDPNGVKVMGVRAQDVNNLYPELIALDKNGYMMVNYCKLRKIKEKRHGYGIQTLHSSPYGQITLG